MAHEASPRQLRYRRRMSTAPFVPTTAASVRGQHTLPQAMYVSPEHFMLEWERVFGQRWLLVLREEELKAPRD